MKWVSLLILLLFTGCIDPESKRAQLYEVRIWLSDKWQRYEMMDKKQLNSFMQSIEHWDNIHYRFIEFGDLLVNKQQIKAIRIK